MTFVAGRKAIMTIYEGETADDWVEKEQIMLSDLKTKVCVSCSLFWPTLGFEGHLISITPLGRDACVNGRERVSYSSCDVPLDLSFLVSLHL